MDFGDSLSEYFAGSRFDELRELFVSEMSERESVASK